MDQFKISLTQTDIELVWDNTKGTILELCESSGLSPLFGCRMGTCGTCETKLINGTFTYDPEPFMEAEEHSVLICCAIPTSDMKIEL